MYLRTQRYQGQKTTLVPSRFYHRKSTPFITSEVPYCFIWLQRRQCVCLRLHSVTVQWPCLICLQAAGSRSLSRSRYLGQNFLYFGPWKNALRIFDFFFFFIVCFILVLMFYNLNSFAAVFLKSAYICPLEAHHHPFGLIIQWLRLCFLQLLFFYIPSQMWSQGGSVLPVSQYEGRGNNLY